MRSQPLSKPDLLQLNGWLIIPSEAWQEQGFIWWGMPPRPETRKPPGGLLDAFRKLHSALDEHILDFVRKYGALWVCREHGHPTTDDNDEDRHCGVNVGGLLDGKRGMFFVDSIEGYRKLARLLNATCNASAEIALNRPIRERDWETIRQETRDYPPLVPMLPKKRVDSREALETVMRFLIINAGVRPAFHWDPRIRTWRLDLEGRGLFGALVVQTLLFAGDVDRFALCTSCHRSYLPIRRPDPTRRNYCPDCGVRAARRDAARDLRERQRKARERRTKR